MPSLEAPLGAAALEDFHIHTHIPSQHNTADGMAPSALFLAQAGSEAAWNTSAGTFSMLSSPFHLNSCVLTVILQYS